MINKELNKQYHKAFVESMSIKINHLNETPTNVISEVRSTIQSGLFRTKDEREKLKLLIFLKNQLCQLYNIE